MYQRFLFIIGTKAGPFKRTKDTIFGENGKGETAATCNLKLFEQQ